MPDIFDGCCPASLNICYAAINRPERLCRDLNLGGDIGDHLWIDHTFTIPHVATTSKRQTQREIERPAIVQGIRDLGEVVVAQVVAGLGELRGVGEVQGFGAKLQAALAADRSITIVHPIYDGMTAFAVAGVRAAGAQRRVRIGTVDGSDFVLRMIQRRAAGGIVLFDVGYSLDWQGWADVDVILRVLLGLPVPETQNLPLRLFDASNVGEAGTPPSPLKGYGAAYRTGYARLWGIATSRLPAWRSAGTGSSVTAGRSRARRSGT